MTESEGNEANMIETLKMIGDLDNNARAKAQERLDNLSKPLGSLGKLEEIVIQIAGINGNSNPKVDKKIIIVMCADNGVVDEGVTQVGREVTAIVTRNFEKGITGINVLSKHAGAELLVVDIGVESEIGGEAVLNKKIRNGTWNIAKGPAMTIDEALQGIQTGIDIVKELKQKGINLIGTGEMGIGNTTTSSAIATVLARCEAEYMVGRGAGLSNEGFSKKLSVVKQAIEINKPNPNDALDVLSKLGGFDIAGLVGCFIGAAAHRIPILIDGFISAAAALVAICIEPKVRDFILPSHGSAEPGSIKIMEVLGFEPMLNLGMRLGEGTGAALAFHIIDAAFAAYNQMGTFGDATIDQYIPQT